MTLLLVMGLVWAQGLTDECSQEVSENFQNSTDLSIEDPKIAEFLKGAIGEKLQFVGQARKPLPGTDSSRICVWRGDSFTLVSTYCRERSAKGKGQNLYQYIFFDHKKESARTLFGELNETKSGRSFWIYNVTYQSSYLGSAPKNWSQATVDELYELTAKMVDFRAQYDPRMQSCYLGVAYSSERGKGLVRSCRCLKQKQDQLPVWLSGFDSSLRPTDDLTQKWRDKVQAAADSAVAVAAKKSAKTKDAKPTK